MFEILLAITLAATVIFLLMAAIYKKIKEDEEITNEIKSINSPGCIFEITDKNEEI